MPRPLMIFAAGFGTRMGMLTRDRPKPLLPVAGITLLDRALALGRAAGARPLVVNTHYLAGQVAAHLAGAEDVTISHEPEILETGGGLRAALPRLGPGPVATLNPDGVWTGPNPLSTLDSAWDAERMEALLLLAPHAATRAHAGPGDFALAADGRIARARGAPGALVYTGAQILRTEGLAEIAERAFSLNRLWDAMAARGGLYGVLHPGHWADAGTPEGLAATEALLAGAPGNG